MRWHTLGTKNPSNTPAWKSEALGQTINNKDIILIDVLYVLRRGDRAAVAVASIVVPGIEFITDEGGTTTADILDLSQLGVRNDATSGVAGIRGQNDGGAAGNLFRDTIRMDMIAVLLRKRNRNGRELGEPLDHTIFIRVERGTHVLE